MAITDGIVPMRLTTLAPDDAEVRDHAMRILAVDRRYMRVHWHGETLPLEELRARLAPAMAQAPEERTDRNNTALRALYLLGATATRLEQTQMRIDHDHVRRSLAGIVNMYAAVDPEVTGVRPEDLDALPDPDLVELVLQGRRHCDSKFLRVLEIDGETWFRTEHVLPTDPVPLGPELTRVREEARRQIAARGDCLPLVTASMKRAAEDPRHRADHATLMCPRGSHVYEPDQLVKQDFGIYVVFPGEPATWDREDWQRSQAAVRSAMFAHHATKKSKIAKRLYGSGTYTPDPLSDDLGTLGIYHNEDAHHRGHQVAGVSSAMRSVMPLSLGTSEEPVTLHSLTDWRLSRNTSDPDRRFTLPQFPSFYRYGLVIRAAVEEMIKHGRMMPAMLGDFRG